MLRKCVSEERGAGGTGDASDMVPIHVHADSARHVEFAIQFRGVEAAAEQRSVFVRYLAPSLAPSSFGPSPVWRCRGGRGAAEPRIVHFQRMESHANTQEANKRRAFRDRPMLHFVYIFICCRLILETGLLS